MVGSVRLTEVGPADSAGNQARRLAADAAAAVAALAALGALIGVLVAVLGAPPAAPVRRSERVRPQPARRPAVYRERPRHHPGR